jgi:hypothetical protein
LTYGYLAGAEALTHRFLRRRSGERDFCRVIIVAALGRNKAGTKRLFVVSPSQPLLA